MRRVLAVLAVAAVAVPATAAAKSWVQFSGYARGVVVGEPWEATLTFPLHPDAPPLPRRPELVFTHFDSYEQRRFYAEPTVRRGVYRARVSLPIAGIWSVYVYGREIGSGTPAPGQREVRVRPRDAGPGANGLALGAGALGVIAVAMLGFVARRRASRSSG
jgi:hypothetical protein